MRPTVYLAGRVQHAPNGGEAWRNEIIDNYSSEFNFNNPLDKYNVPKEDLEVVDHPNGNDNMVTVDEIVEGDKELIHNSDGILVGYTEGKSIGTPMEVMMGWHLNMPIVMLILDDTNIQKLSPWYRYHVDGFTDDAESALEYLKGNRVATNPIQ